ALIFDQIVAAPTQAIEPIAQHTAGLGEFADQQPPSLERGEARRKAGPSRTPGQAHPLQRIEAGEQRGGKGRPPRAAPQRADEQGEDGAWQGDRPEDVAVPLPAGVREAVAAMTGTMLGKGMARPATAPPLLARVHDGGIMARHLGVEAADAPTLAPEPQAQVGLLAGNQIVAVTAGLLERGNAEQ